MYRTIPLNSRPLAAMSLGLALACAGLPDLDEAVAPSASSAPTQGAAYTLLQRSRVVDHTGFGSPVEALSFLIPHGYRMDSSVTWGDPTCMSNLVGVRVSLTSADGAVQLHQHPVQSWEFTQDQGVQELIAASGGQGLGGCPFRPPVDVAQRLRGTLIPATFEGAREIEIERDADTERELTRAMQAVAAPDVRASVEVGGASLQTPDGRVGLAISILATHRSPSISPYGMPTTHIVQGTVAEITGSAPLDRKEELERLVSLYLTSQRMNPEWDQAVQRTMAQISAGNRAAIAERSRINFETSQAISDINMRSWESRTESQDRGVEQFSQAIRGVETWKEPSGGQVELPHGYGQAWRGADGSYVLSQDPMFDPNKALDQRWERLAR